jgi:chromosomal replication initiation ATPase DnaA
MTDQATDVPLESRKVRITSAITTTAVINAVVRLTGEKEKGLKAPGRERRLARIRQVSMYFTYLRGLKCYALPDIGEMWDRDCSGAMNAVRLVEGLQRSGTQNGDDVKALDLLERLAAEFEVSVPHPDELVQRKAV